MPRLIDARAFALHAVWAVVAFEVQDIDDARKTRSYAWEFGEIAPGDTIDLLMNTDKPADAFRKVVPEYISSIVSGEG